MNMRDSWTDSNSIPRLQLMSVVGSVVLMWTWFTLVQPIPFWHVLDDYAWYALSQALSIESRVAGTPAQNGGFVVHPGVPYAYLNWVALRLAEIGGTNAERVAATLRDPEAFWLGTKICALVLNSLGILAYWVLLRGRPALFLLACSFYFAFAPAVFGFSLLQFTVESFALPFLAGSYAVAAKLFSGVQSRQRPSLRVCAALGALAAAGLSLKIYYLAPTVGITVALGYAAVRRQIKADQLLVMVLAALVGFACMGIPLILGTIGVDGARSWLAWNLEMLGHSGRYGSGGATFLNMSAVGAAMWALLKETNGTAPCVLLILGILLIVSWRTRDTDVHPQCDETLFLIATSTGALLHLVGALKHYLPHYVIPVCVTIGCMLAVLDISRLPRSLLRASLAASLLLLFVNVTSFSTTHQKHLAVARETQEDVRQIEAMPLRPGSKRVWAYLSAARPGLAPLAVTYSGSPWVARIAATTLDSADISPPDVKTSADWGLVILPKVYFKSATGIPAALKGQFDFKPTDFSVCANDSIEELHRFFVLRPAPRQMDGSCA